VNGGLSPSIGCHRACRFIRPVLIVGSWPSSVDLPERLHHVRPVATSATKLCRRSTARAGERRDRDEPRLEHRNHSPTDDCNTIARCAELLRRKPFRTNSLCESVARITGGGCCSSRRCCAGSVSVLLWFRSIPPFVLVLLVLLGCCWLGFCCHVPLCVFAVSVASLVVLVPCRVVVRFCACSVG